MAAGFTRFSTGGPARSRTAQTAIASIQTSWSCAPTMAEWTASLPWGRVETGTATHIGVFANAQNTVLTVGQERIAGGDLAIAVDPNNADHVVVAYTNAPGANGAGVIQLDVTESFDGGATWTQKFTTSSSSRSGQPGVAILANGAIGLLYNNYAPAMGDPATGTLSQHLVTTTDDFATTNDVTLASESNSTPTS